MKSIKGVVFVLIIKPIQTGFTFRIFFLTKTLRKWAECVLHAHTFPRCSKPFITDSSDVWGRRRFSFAQTINFLSELLVYCRPFFTLTVTCYNLCRIQNFIIVMIQCSVWNMWQKYSVCVTIVNICQVRRHCMNAWSAEAVKQAGPFLCIFAWLRHFFSGVFSKLRQSTISFVMSVRLSISLSARME